MKALVLSDFGKIKIQDIEEPTASGKLVKIKVMNGKWKFTQRRTEKESKFMRLIIKKHIWNLVTS